MSQSILRIEPYSVFANMPSLEPEWIWQDIFAVGSCSMLSGKPKAGKSTWVRHFIKAVINGEEFLGKKTEKSQILYLAFEEQREYMKKIFSEAGIDSTEALHVHVGSLDPTQHDKLRKELIDFCETYQIRVLVVDPFIKAFSAFDTNDYGLATKATQFFLDFARNQKVHVLLIHHARKGEVNGQDSAIGSIGFSGGVDNVLILDRSLRYTSLNLVGRYIEEQRLTFTKSGSGLKVIDAKNRDKLIEDLILKSLEENKQLSREQLRGEIQCRDENLTQALKNLSNSGKIQSNGEGVKGSKRLYKLASPLDYNSGEESVEL